MKKCMVGILLLLCFTLSACGRVESFEVVSDVVADYQLSEPAKIKLSIPDDATLSVMNSANGQSYEGDHYQIIVQTYASGDVDQTLQLVTGYRKDQLKTMKVTGETYSKYVCAWSAVSEEGELVGRCAILDDGVYHYCLTVLVDAQMAGELRQDIDALFADYSFEAY